MIAVSLNITDLPCVNKQSLYDPRSQEKVWISPLKQVSDEQEGEGVGDGDVEVRGFGVDPALAVLQVGPGQVDGQPDSVPPEPLVQRVQHPKHPQLAAVSSARQTCTHFNINTRPQT